MTKIQKRESGGGPRVGMSGWTGKSISFYSFQTMESLYPVVGKRIEWE